jgi:glucose-6-phosphatase
VSFLHFLSLNFTISTKFSKHFFSCFKFEEILGHFSTFFGSSFLYLYIIPLITIYSTKLYHRTLIACVASDFINLIMKWILDEDRPYWWIHESKAYTSLTRPTLYQTERTCETSAGSPSGHLMLAACFLHVIYDEINSRIRGNAKLKILNKVALLSLLFVTAVSRMYFAAHFLHQCILGGVIGILVSTLMTRRGFSERFARFEKRTWVTIIVWMVISVISIYWAHKFISGNPMKSVQLAFQHCKDPLYPKPETTVVFSAIRCVAMSCGLLLNAPIKRR